MASRYSLAAALTFTLLVPFSHSQTCKDYAFHNGNTYESCIDHYVLGTFLHWNYSSATSIADVAFRRPATTSSQWIAWAINPIGRAMVGSQALVAYLTTDGTVRAYTSPIESRVTQLTEGPLSFPASNVSGSYVDGELTIFARLQVASGVVSSSTQVWEVGMMSSPGVPAGHPPDGDNIRSVMRLNFLNNADYPEAASSAARSMRKINHSVRGMLTSLWTVLPLGAMVAHFA
ncbi:hypothetical protein MLD38_033438 [Melastoma candidum]|uniref:Uncharacterized protein n=1 Tax=Melastoma candidum TaxID=119954 RepID=A0ACB9M906_9MYRT|nr:hypothetical protein MLD38_033438 [Melastoma candidum]